MQELTALWLMAVGAVSTQRSISFPNANYRNKYIYEHFDQSVNGESIIHQHDYFTLNFDC